MRTCNTIQTGKRPFPSRTLRALGTTAAAVLTLCAALIAAVISVTLSSCEHKEFCAPEPPSARVRVLFDWKNAPGASATGMSLYLYPEEGGDALRYDFPNASGGTVEIPFGRYRALFLNNDSEVNLMRGTEDFSSFEVYTRNSWPLEPLGLQDSSGDPPSADEPVVLASGPLWGGQDFPVEIPPAGVRAVNGGAEPDMQLTLFPARRTCVYTVEIVNVRNLKYASAMSFSLSGLSGSVSPGTGRRSAMRSTVPFPARIDESSSRVAARFLCFGTSTSGNNARTLSLYVISSDGSRQYYTFDVGAQVNRAADPGSVHILIDGLTLPRPIVNGGGFHPSVEEWENVTEEIDM